MDIEILEIDGNWVTAIINGRWCMAKLYTEGSTYGINNTGVSKLSISKTNNRKKNENFLNQMCYHYDRGLDFDRCHVEELVSKIVEKLDWFASTKLAEANGY